MSLRDILGLIPHLRIIPSKSGSVTAGIHADSPRDASPPAGITFRLVNVKTGKALDVTDGSTTAGAALVQSPVSNRPSQLWTVRSAQGSLLIVNAHSGHSINIPRKSSLNRLPLIQWTVADGAPNQSWIFHRDGQAFRIASRWNNLLIAASDKPDANGPVVQLFPRGGDEELWQVVSVSR